MVISGRWPPAVPGGFVDVVGVPALQPSPGAFVAPLLTLEGTAKRVTDLPLFNKKQIASIFSGKKCGKAASCLVLSVFRV